MAMTINAMPPRGGEWPGAAILGSRDGGGQAYGGGCRAGTGTALHLVLAELLVGQVLEPLLEAPHVHGFLGRFDRSRARDHRLVDEDRRPAAQGEGDGVG